MNNRNSYHLGNSKDLEAPSESLQEQRPVKVFIMQCGV